MAPPSSRLDHVQTPEAAGSEPSQSPAPVPTVSIDNVQPHDAPPAVRFSSAVQEISPTTTSAQQPSLEPDAPPTDDAPAQAQTATAQSLQERRMNTFHFEAFSLPPSRVHSRDDESPSSTRLPTPNSSRLHSPHGSPRLAALASPPLTPSGSYPTRQARERGSVSNDPHLIITPHPTSSHEKPPSVPERMPLTHRPASSDQITTWSSSSDNAKSHRRNMFGVGPGSVPVSRESSPSRTSASHFYSKPVTPDGDAHDPYAKGRRPPQQPHPSRHTLDPRFVFAKKKKHGSPGGSKSSLSEKRGTPLLGSRNGSDEQVADVGHASASHGSMADLKRFFRKPIQGHHHKKSDSSPSAVKLGSKSSLCSRSTQQLPFSEDHGLTSKYGKLGKVLGSGAGGSVRVMKRKEDGTVFAVKEFRARHSYESEKEYSKKVTAEFCVGSTLHHGNIIETLDILQEKGRWFEVMEYAPYDLFAIVMTGKMSREEIRCCFLQILNGVTYLHSVGLAHRDLKLDNVVVNERGIMKIIDFGSAHVFKYPFENDTVLAKGIVGSDPYLAPEVYESKEYNAPAVDIWSLAIIFCCMTLRRFPWKIPRMSDNSFKLFASEPTPKHDPKRLLMPSKPCSEPSTPAVGHFAAEDKARAQSSPHIDHHARTQSPTTSHHPEQQEKQAYGPGHDHGSSKSETSEATPAAGESHSQPAQSQGTAGERKEVIRGPWRILRLLPRESRRIIYRMLDLDPKTRAAMSEILQEPWVADTVICQQLENGLINPADDHTHVLEPPASQQQQQHPPK